MTTTRLASILTATTLGIAAVCAIAFAQPSGAVRVMPLGDSITEACCWRDLLYARLHAEGRPVDFVGSRKKIAIAGQDWDHEGHGGYRVTDVLKAAGSGRPERRGLEADQRDLVTWFGPQAEPADIVLMHFGTNDRWAGVAPARILEGYDAVLAAARASNPDVTVLVAQILPMAVGVDVAPLNAAIPAWAKRRDSPRSRVIVVDQATGFDLRWTLDGVHPDTRAGSQWLADRWYAALRPLLPPPR